MKSTTRSNRMARRQAMPDGHAPLALHSVPMHQPFSVLEVVYPEGDGEWAQRLEELGFLPGERVMVIGAGWPGSRPLAVRVGLSTFALRLEEAACVRLVPVEAGHE